MKQIFWEEVIPNIEQYELLDDDMKEYFDRDALFIDANENFYQSLKHNEPKGKGKDFLVNKTAFQDSGPSTSEDEDIDQERLHAHIKEVFKNPTSYKSNFGWETDSDPDDNCIKIKTMPQETTHEFDDLKEIARTFNAMLRTEDDDKELSLEEVKLRLSDADVVSNEQLSKLPRKLKGYLADYGPLRKHLTGSEATEFAKNDNKENENTSSSLDVPSTGDSMLVRTPSTAGLLDSSNKSLSLRSHSAALTARQHSTPATHKPRSKRIVDEPSVNPRMERFVKTFIQPLKRRRDSISPEST